MIPNDFSGKQESARAKLNNPGGLTGRAAEALLVFVFSAIAVWLYFHYGNLDFHAPILYAEDGLAGLAGTKMCLTDGRQMFGWPYHSDSFAYEPVFNAIYRIFIFAAHLFTGDYIFIHNLYIVLIPLANVVVSYYVLKSFGIRSWIAFAGSLLFGLCPYVQYRLSYHLSLAAVECIPLGFLFCFWLLEDPKFNQPGRNWFRYRRNLAALLLSFLIANNGMVYYPYFTCFLLVVTGAYLAFDGRSVRKAVPAVITIAMICGWLAIGFLPTILGALQGAGNAATYGAARGVSRASVYGLDIKALLLSPKGYGLPMIAERYKNFLDISNEKNAAYMGITAILGFFGLLFLLITDRPAGPAEETEYLRRARFLAKLNIAAVLLAVYNGICIFVSILVTQISCYNRISPFLVFASVLLVCLTLEELLRKFGNARFGKLIPLFAALLFVYSFWEQQDVYLNITDPGRVQLNRTEAKSDEAFFRAMEEEAGAGAMVFNLPYMKSFENGRTNRLYDYDHYKGYLYSDSIRWSFGAMPGTENNSWYFSTASLPEDALVYELSEKGFQGIYLNLDGYDAEEGPRLASALQAAAGAQEVLKDEDASKLYISLEHYQKPDKVPEAIAYPPIYFWLDDLFAEHGKMMDGEALSVLSEQMLSGDQAVFEVIYEMLDEPGLSNQEYVHTLYTTILRREESVDENNGKISAMEGGVSRYELMMDFFRSEEFTNQYHLKLH